MQFAGVLQLTWSIMRALVFEHVPLALGMPMRRMSRAMLHVYCAAVLGCGSANPSDVLPAQGCREESDAVFCARHQRVCGSVTSLDNCGSVRTVPSCGTCGSADARDGGSGRGEADAGTQCPVSNRDPPNLFPNGDFECGSESFQSSGGNGRVDFVAGRTGKALRLTVAPGVFNNEFTSSWRFRLEQSGVYCARAFVRGSATTVVLRLYVGPPGAAMGEMFSMPGPRGLWSMLPPTVTAIQAAGMAGDEAFLVFADSSPSVGATIEVDDVDVWLSRDGSCRER
jgi:hypothetical protein